MTRHSRELLGRLSFGAFDPVTVTGPILRLVGFRTGLP